MNFLLSFFIINYHKTIVNTILLFLLTFVFMVWYNEILSIWVLQFQVHIVHSIHTNHPSLRVSAYYRKHNIFLGNHYHHNVFSPKIHSFPLFQPHPQLLKTQTCPLNFPPYLLKNIFCLFFVCFVCIQQNNTKNHYSTLAYINIIFNISQSITRFYKKIQKCDFIINRNNTRLYSISLETLVNTRFLH